LFTHNLFCGKFAVSVENLQFPVLPTFLIGYLHDGANIEHLAPGSMVISNLAC